MKENQEHKSLSEIHGSIEIPKQYKFFKRLMAFIGPAYLVSIGYMDPGNWATDIAGGSQFGYALIWVLLMSNLMAVLLQSLSARLGIVAGMDLAQACAAHYRKGVNITLWLLTELAIIATDLAEVLGSAIGLQLLFHIPLTYGVIITALDTFVILMIQKFGIRKLEAIIVGYVAIIGFSFLVEIFLSKPDYHQVALGFIPSLPGPGALFIAIGILGATVMPHNLYLHSSLVQSRNIEKTHSGIKQAIKFNVIDSFVALNLAFFVNAAILVMAGAVFHKSGNTTVSEIQDAYRLLEPLIGTALAPILFGVALIASGQASTITGTLTGQIIMEGFVNIRLQPWLRRVITRSLAIIPALIVIVYSGEGSTGMLLVLSQVILSLQLPFAIVPLIHFVSNSKLMKEFAIPSWTKVISWVVALIIIVLNLQLVLSAIQGWVTDPNSNIALNSLAIGSSLVLIVLLIYIIAEPYLPNQFNKPLSLQPAFNIHGQMTVPQINMIRPFERIAVALDFTDKDGDVLSYGLSMARENTTLILMHVIESAGAQVYGNTINDTESKLDKLRLENYAKELRKLGVTNIVTEIGYGNAVKSLSEIINAYEADIAIFGSHGHKGFKDLLFGITTNKVKDHVKIPILTARKNNY